MILRGEQRRAPRVLRVVGAVIGLVATWALAVAASLLIHLDVPATRRLAATEVTRVLGSVFEGGVTVERIGHIDLGGVSGVRVRVTDPTRTTVILAEGLLARIDTPAFVRSLVSGKGDLAIPLPKVRLEQADLALDANAAGAIRLAKAFTLRPRKPGQVAKKPGRQVHLEAPDVSIGHVWVHGAPGRAPSLDVDVASASGSMNVVRESFHADVDRSVLVARSLPPRGAVLRGDATASLTTPRAGTDGIALAATVGGTLGGAPVAAHGRLEGRKVDAVLDVADVTSESLRAIVAEVPITQPLSVRAEARGELPHLEATARATLGGGTLATTASFDLEAKTVRADVKARHVDLAAASSRAPVSDLGFDVRGSIAFGKETHGDVALDTVPGRLADQTIPRIVARLFVAGESAWGAARIHDPSMPTEVSLALTPQGRDRVVDAQVHSELPDLGRVPFVGKVASGSARLRADARFALGARTILGHVDVAGEDLAHGASHAKSLRGIARIDGTIENPSIEADLHADAAQVGRIEARLLDARAHVRRERGRAIVVDDARLIATGRAVQVSASVDRLAVEDRRVDLTGGVIEGFGAPVHVDLARDPREVRIVADAPSVDLRRVASFFGRGEELRGGHFELRGDVALGHGEATGQIHARLDDLTTAEIRRGHGRLDARIVGKDVDLALRAELADAGHVEITTSDLALGGSPIEAASWRAATGRIAFDGTIDLGRAMRFVPYEDLPVGELAGKLVVVGAVERRNEAAPPGVRMSAHTIGLAVAGKSRAPFEPEIALRTVQRGQPWRTRDFDFEVDTLVDALSRHAEIAVRGVDAQGPVFAFDAKAIIPFDAILAHPTTAAAELERMPFRAKVTVPTRALDHLPPVLGVRGFVGEVDADLDVEGPATDPRVDLVAHVRNARSLALPVRLAADSDVVLSYDGQTAALTAKVTSGGKEVLALGSKLDLRASDLFLRTPGAELPWDATLSATLDEFPLEAVDAIASRRVRGRVSGWLSLEDLHHDARLHALFSTTNLRIGRAQYKRGDARFDVAGGDGVALVRLEQTDGHAELRAETGVTWGAALVPRIDGTRQVDARVDAVSFRASAIAPFVQGVLDELDGRIDAHASAKLGPRPEDTQMQGRVTLRDGTVQIAAIGEELRDASLTATLSPDGTIRIKDARARSIEGQVSADAVIKTKGLAVDSVDASLRVPTDKPIDFALQGQPIGRISGEAQVKAAFVTEENKIAIDVDVPKLAVELPHVTKTQLQPLGDPAYVRVGTFRAPNDFVALPLDEKSVEGGLPPKEGTTVDMDVRLRELVVTRGTQLRATLAGQPHVVVTDKTRIDGQLTVRSGKLSLQGKEFEIERGTITFKPDDATNPQVVATAAWTADDGSRVFAEFAGPVKTGKVELRSEPPRPKNEILALILFGTVDEANATPVGPSQAGAETTRAAVAAGGGFATQGLTAAIDQLTGIPATASIDTSRTANPRPEVQFQVARGVSIRFSHVLGTPPISEPDTNYATVNWRFKRSWSLESTFGDQGSTQLDAIWQKRY